MDNYKQLIIIKGEPKDDIIRCYYDKVKKKQVVVFNNNPNTYYYSYNNVKWLDSTGELDKNDYKFFLKSGQENTKLKSMNRLPEKMRGCRSL